MEKRKNTNISTFKNVWETFKHFKIKDTRVVLLGQDPYINSEYYNNKDIPQAMDLSFSVPKTHKIPPSLRNIFKELKSDLSRWVKKQKHKWNFKQLLLIIDIILINGLKI